MTMTWQTLKAHRFWVLCGAGVLATLALWLVWILRIPTVRSYEDWSRQVGELEQLRDSAGQIPSPSSLTEFQAYRKWLDEQARLVTEYFRDRTDALERSVANLENISPAEFKSAYKNAIANETKTLRDRGLGVPGTPFLVPAWVNSPAMPQPGEYRTIVRDLGARVAIYKLCATARAAGVNRLEVMQKTPVSEYFDGLPISLDVLVPADRVYAFVNEFLRVAPRDSRPVCSLTRITVTPNNPARQLCLVSLDGYVLMLKDTLPNQPGGRP